MACSCCHLENFPSVSHQGTGERDSEARSFSLLLSVQSIKTQVEAPFRTARCKSGDWHLFWEESRSYRAMMQPLCPVNPVPPGMEGMPCSWNEATFRLPEQLCRLPGLSCGSSSMWGGRNTNTGVCPILTCPYLANNVWDLGNLLIYSRVPGFIWMPVWFCQEPRKLCSLFPEIDWW